MRDVWITGIGSYLPRTGVERRGWAADDETIAAMAVAAAGRALERAHVSAERLDLVILSNWTQRRFVPEHAPLVQHLLGAHRAAAFDVCCACAGFVYGLSIAASFLEEKRIDRALVVASETTSKRARPGSRAMPSFGDGAGAVVLERGARRGLRLVEHELMTDGSRHFAHACSSVLDRARRTMDSIDWIVPHSGTAGIQATLAKTLGVPAERVLTNLGTVGNVSSAAIPIALDQYLGDGTICPGDTVLSPTTGTGWYAAAMILEVVA